MALFRLAVDDVDLMEWLANRRPGDDAREYETHYYQLGRGPFQGVLETFRAGYSLLLEAAGIGDDGRVLPPERAILNASHQSYGARIRLRGCAPPDRTCFWLFPLSSGPVRWRGAPLPPGSLIEHPPSNELDLVAEGLDVVTFSFRHEVRDSIFASTGHRSVSGALSLPPEVSGALASTVLAHLRSHHSGPGDDDLEHRIQEQFSLALASLPARIEPRVAGDRRRRAVRRAEAFLHEHLDRLVPSHELAAVAEVPLRTLQDGFRREFGFSPSAFHGLLRLQAARRVLQHSTQDSGLVSDVARSHAFYHLGRFALEYKQRFGESPSATLRRRPTISERSRTSMTP